MNRRLLESHIRCEFTANHVGSYRQPICIQFLYSFRTGGAPPPCRMTIAAGLPARVCRVWQGRSDSSSVLIHKKYHISQ